MPVMHVLTDRDPADESRNFAGLDVLSWRYDRLHEAGYPVDMALMLAERMDIDLHVACRLLARGATVHEAIRILT